MASPGSLGFDTSTITDKTPQQFVYLTLNLSRSEFRLLYLYPGQYEDDIKALLATVDLHALPLSFDDEAHFTQLNKVFQALSTAVDQSSGFQFAELLR
jgi:hypothetical protein